LNNNAEIKLQLQWPWQLEANISHNGSASADSAVAVFPGSQKMKKPRKSNLLSVKLMQDSASAELIIRLTVKNRLLWGRKYKKLKGKLRFSHFPARFTVYVAANCAYAP